MAVGTYGRPLVFFQIVCEPEMSPVPPGERAKALLTPSEINLVSVFHSSRVILPSLFRSRLSKESFNKVFCASALDKAPSLLVSASLRRESNDGIWFSLSSAPPGDQPAKNNVPPAITGEAQGPVG